MNIICDECGTENEPEYEYCKNCGARLRNSKTANSDIKNSNGMNYGYTQYGQNQQYQAAYNQYAQQYSNINGISREEFAAFIGKNSAAIINKFEGMEKKGTNISWCWATTVLSILFGPLGAALWFFYRKLYKPAAIFMAAGLISMTLSTAIVFADLPISITDTVNDVFYAIESAEPGKENQAAAETLKPVVEKLLNYKNLAASAITNVTSIVCFVMSSMLAYGIYKKRAIDAILKCRANNMDPRYYSIGLTAVGGTSVGMLILGIAIMIFAPSIISAVLGIMILI